MPKRLKVENVLPFVAAPQMPVLDGFASSSGGSYRDDFDDAASATESIESASGIDTPTGSPPPSPVLPHAPGVEVAPLSHRLRNVRVRPLFPGNPVFLANNKLLLKSPQQNENRRYLQCQGLQRPHAGG